MQGMTIAPVERATNEAAACNRHSSPLMQDLLQYLNDCKFILVSNREPYEHVRGARGIEVRQPAGGLVSALDPTMRRIHGTWVAWGSGDADKETSDESGRVQVPPAEQSYSLRRVWLEDSEVEAYYHGFANRSLWPLCHMLIHYFEYRTEFWDRYRAVNLRFAHAVADEAGSVVGRTVQAVTKPVLLGEADGKASDFRTGHTGAE